MRARQRGVALITAMLIVAIVATLATTIALGQQVWLRQTQNLADLIQAERLRQGALEGAALLLAFDAKNPQTKDTDHLEEEWAKQLKPAAIENGVAVMTIHDAQARFNLNNLIPRGQGQSSGSGQGTQPAGNPYRSIYQRLLEQSGLSPDLVSTLIDWLDDNPTTEPNGGAEDLDYLNANAKTPYRAGNNNELKSVNELLLIKGYTREVVEELRRYVIALPASAGATPINVNTAEPVVLAALTGLSLPQAQQIADARKSAPFKDQAAFKQHPLLVNNQQLASAAATYDVKSGYFIVSVATLVGRIQRLTEALIERPSTGNNVQVLWYQYPPVKIVLDLDEDKS
jgi:general secretion pathway protein K